MPLGKPEHIKAHGDEIVPSVLRGHQARITSIFNPYVLFDFYLPLVANYMIQMQAALYGIPYMPPNKGGGYMSYLPVTGYPYMMPVQHQVPLWRPPYMLNTPV